MSNIFNQRTQKNFFMRILCGITLVYIYKYINGKDEKKIFQENWKNEAENEINEGNTDNENMITQL